MTNQDKLLDIIRKDVEENNLDNIQFFPGDTSTASVENFCEAIVHAYETEEQNRFTIIKEL